MSYKQWFEAHAAKHKAIIEKISSLSDDEIIKYFRFENMLIHEPDFCPLYKEAKKCHDTDELNCYLCACPNFRFNDEGLETSEGKTLFSSCSIDSPDGDQFIHENSIHQNCSGCLIPHKESYIKKIFSRDWLSIMKEVPNDKEK